MRLKMHHILALTACFSLGLQCLNSLFNAQHCQIKEKPDAGTSDGPIQFVLRNKLFRPSGLSLQPINFMSKQSKSAESFRPIAEQAAQLLKTHEYTQAVKEIARVIVAQVEPPFRGECLHYVAGELEINNLTLLKAVHHAEREAQQPVFENAIDQKDWEHNNAPIAGLDLNKRFELLMHHQEKIKGNDWRDFNHLKTNDPQVLMLKSIWDVVSHLLLKSATTQHDFNQLAWADKGFNLGLEEARHGKMQENESAKRSTAEPFELLEQLHSTIAAKGSVKRSIHQTISQSNG